MPSKVLTLTALGLREETENRMVRHMIDRLKYHRKQMGWTSDRTYTQDSWLWKRHIATRWHDNDVSWRARPGSLFGKMNMTRGLLEQAVTHHWSRIKSDLLPNHEFFGIGPEGPEDKDPAIAEVQRFLHKRAKVQKLDLAARSAIQKALIRGEVVGKATQVHRRIQVPITARPVIQDGKILRTTKNEMVHELDEWRPDPTDPGRELLAKDPALRRKAGGTLPLGDRRIQITQTRLERGADLTWMHYADFVTQLNVASLDDAEITAHIFDKSVYDLLDEIPREIQNPRAVREYLKTRREKGAEQGTEATQPRTWAGELEDTLYDTTDEAFRTGRFAEIYARYSPYGGRYERMYLLADLDLEVPIHYSYAHEMLDWTDRPHPFQCLRIYPSTDDRWYGMGYYGRYLDQAMFGDKCWNRIELALQTSGNLLFEDPQATDEGRQGIPLSFRSTTTRKLRAGFTGEDALSVVTVQPQIEGIADMMAASDERMASIFGITSANDPTLKDMPAADTLGGMELLSETSNVGVRAREDELLDGLNPAIIAWTEAELSNVPAEDVIGVLGVEKGQMALAWIAANKNRLNEVVAVKTEVLRKQRDLQDNQQIIALLSAWIGVPPLYRESWREVYAERLRKLGVKDPEALLINPEAEMQEMGASPASAAAAVAGVPDPEAPPPPKPNQA